MDVEVLNAFLAIHSPVHSTAYLTTPVLYRIWPPRGRSAMTPDQLLPSAHGLATPASGCAHSRKYSANSAPNGG